MIKLYNENCLDRLKVMADRSVDCIVTDCPYRIVAGGCTNIKDRLGGFLNTESDLVKAGKIFGNNGIEFSDWLPEVYRVLKDGTHCYIMINPRNLKDLWAEAEKVGFVFQNLLVWDKGNVTPNKWYMQAYELILMLRKGKARNINNMGEQNILRVPNIVRKKQHPTEKPVELMMILIENSTKEGEVVLDPFMGVGGTGIACKKLNRSFIGIEIDKKYYDIAVERNNSSEQMSIAEWLDELMKVGE